MFQKGDFHIHSTSSDGNCTPAQIVNIAKKKHVDIIALTDHNTTLGIDEAIKEGNKINIKVIPGVELSTRFNNTRVHILGYFKDDSYKNELLLEVLHNVKVHDIKQIRFLLKGYLDNFLRSPKLTVEEGIAILRFFGASVVLAHPVLLPKEDFNEIVELNFDGLEAKYYSNTEQDTSYFINLCKEKNLFYTAGSDFHKTNDFYRAHGLIGDVYLNSTEIDFFLKRSNILCSI